jgi:hypothetical protein
MSAESRVKKVHRSSVKMFASPDQAQTWKRVIRLIEEWSVIYPDLSAWLEETIAGDSAVVFTFSCPDFHAVLLECLSCPWHDSNACAFFDVRKHGLRLLMTKLEHGSSTPK